MPINHRVSFDKKKCPDDPAARARIPGCNLPNDKPFTPQSRHPPKPKPDVPVFPIPGKDIPVFPIPGKEIPVFPIPDAHSVYRGTISPKVYTMSKTIQESQVTEDIKLEARLAELSYDWRSYYDMGINAHKKAGLYDDETHLTNDEGIEMEDLNFDQRKHVQQVSEKNAMRRINTQLEEEGSNLRVDTQLSSIQTGGLVLVDDTVVPLKAYYVFHGRQAGMTTDLEPNSIQGRSGGLYHHPESRFPHDEARNVSIIDDISVHRSAVSTPFSTDTTSELYPSLRTQAQLLKSKYGVDNIKGVWYSNGGVKGHFLAREEGIGGTMLDPMMGARQARDMTNGFDRPVEYIRTSGLSVMSGAQNIAEAFGGPGKNVTVTNIPQRKGVAWHDFMENHGVNAGGGYDIHGNFVGGDLGGYSLGKYNEAGEYVPGDYIGLNDAMRTSDPMFQKVQGKPGFISGFKDALKATPKSLATGLASGAIISALDPNKKLGDQGDLLATAGTNVILDSTVAGTGAAITGAPVLATAGAAFAELAAPTVVAYEVVDTVGKAMDNATKDWKNRDAAATAYGAATGSSAGAAAYISAKTLQSSFNAVKLLRAARVVRTANEAAEGIEMTTTGAEATAGAAEEISTAGIEGIEMTTTGAEATAGEGVFGAVMGAAETAEAGLITATEGAGVVAGAEGGLNPVADAAFVGLGVVAGATALGVALANVFHHTDSKEEKEAKRVAVQTQLEDKYISISNKYIAAQQANTFNVNEFTPLKPEDVLTDDEIKFMTSHQPKYFETVNSSLNEVWQHERNKYNSNQNILAKQKEHKIEVADSYDEVNHKAQSESFYSTDEMVFANAVDEWTPDQSTILKAHQQGLTLKMFNEYMTATSKGKQFIQGQMVEVEGPEMNKSDIEHFRSDLVYAGYKPDAYTYQKDPSGIYKFVRNSSVPLERDATQIAEVNLLRQLKGDEYISKLVNSDGSLSTKLNELSKNVLFTTDKFQVDLNKFDSAPFSWQTYESYQPNGNVVNVEQPTQLNTFSQNLIKQEKEKLSARKFGMTREIYEQTKQYISDKNIPVKTKQDVISANTDMRNENLESLNPNLETQNKFTSEQIDTLESGGQVTNSGDHSVYAAA